MPQGANITIKNVANADVLWTFRAPSAGDSTPAVWKQLSAGVAPAFQPELRVVARDAAKGARRAVRGTFMFPDTVTENGRTISLGAIQAAYDFTFAKTIPSQLVEEAATQFGRLMASALIIACNSDGYSAT